ncbi:Kelch repeat-containing protein 3 [Diplodia seriata]|uniref:Kelch repeat-containing protein 3 n=1 Tax=Diplodia seriata TaxID=420778 RepID=A0A1S8BF76_9PEZI|nr:Kelch repeat-containing protein 3 [Diplodia seriata]
MAKKADKAKKAEKKARTAAKQEKKAGKKEQKNQKRPKDNGDDSDADDVDIDAVLAEYARQQEQFLKVTEAVSEPPSARGSATLIGSPTNDNELFLFGGEYFNGALAHFYNDLFVYNIHRDEWRKVTSPNTPLPRSGHAWTRGGNDKAVYLFGGEFSSPKQGTFYHYNDLWRLEPGSREWMRLETKGKGPPARSGHRMTYFKNYIVLFGGFQDTSQQTRYLNDVWIYDTATYQWHEPKLPPVGQRPDARSSFSFLPSDAGAVLYGGYSRVKQAAKGGGSGKGGPASRNVLKPVVHQDTWFLRIVPVDGAPLPKVHWERRKKPANPPNPPRAGATMAFHKGRGILFGGVHDVEESEEGIDSEFFNQLFAWNIDRNRYFPLALRKPRAQGKKQTGAGDRGGRRGRGKADEEELLRNLKALEMRGTLAGADEDGELPADGAGTPGSGEGKKGDEDDGDKPDRPPKTVQFEMPHPRFNAALAVQDDVLYVFGGTFEKADREFTFDEMWAIDLGKLEGVKEIFRRELEDWQGEESEDEDEDEDEEDEEDEDDEAAGSDEDDVASTAATSVSAAPSKEKEVDEVDTADEKHKSASALSEDGLPHPRPFEALRDFYARSTNEWQNVIIDELARKYGGEAKMPKEIKTMAFERAEEKWWDCREEIRALEDEQEQAGISEVVSLAERGDAAAGGAGRRR